MMKQGKTDQDIPEELKEEAPVDAQVQEEKEGADQTEKITAFEEEAERLEDLVKESQDYKDKYLRALAESENTRKRMQKEKQDQGRFLVQGALTSFLQPLDHFENALKAAENMSDEIRNWVIGFEMIMKQFQEALEQQGIRPFVSLGEQFDPHLHDAVETEETEEHPEGLILKEFVKGYKMGDRIVRAARVKVAKAPKKEEKDSPDTLPDQADQG